MFTKFSFYKSVTGFLALLLLILAACAPTAPVPHTVVEPTKPAVTAAPTKPANTAVPTKPSVTETPAGVISGLKPEEILIQLTYEPGFTLPEYRFSFGRTPYFTLLADGRVIYVDETQDFKVMQAQLTQDEAAALLQKVRDLGFEHLKSHTDMCGKMADGTEPCIADASTTVMKVRMEDGSLREIHNYANFSNGPVVYDAIYNLLNDYVNPKAVLYVPDGATLFVRTAPAPEDLSTPAEWPMDPAFVKRAQANPDQGTAVVLSSEEAAKWVKEVGANSGSVTFQLDGQHVSAMFVPWLPGEDFSKEIAAEFPVQ